MLAFCLDFVLVTSPARSLAHARETIRHGARPALDVCLWHSVRQISVLGSEGCKLKKGGDNTRTQVASTPSLGSQRSPRTVGLGQLCVDSFPDNRTGMNRTCAIVVAPARVLQSNQIVDGQNCCHLLRNVHFK